MSLGISTVCKNIQPSATLAMNDTANALRAKGVQVYSFAAGEPDFDTPLPIRDAMKDALDRGMTRYTPATGSVELKDAILQKLRCENGLEYERKNIIASNGAKHSISTALQAILNPGDEVVIPTPCWVSYPEMVRMAGGTPVFVETSEENGFLPTAVAMRAAVTPRTKAFILTTPNNPTGCVYDEATLRALADLCVEKDFYILSDEIYEHLIYSGRKHIAIAGFGPEVKARTLLVNGVSKTYAMTGFRIGYLAGPADVVAAMGNYQSQATSGPCTPAQHAAAAALAMDQGCVETMRAAFEARRDELCALVNRIPGIHCHCPDGAFYVMMNISRLLGRTYRGEVIADSMSFAQTLLQNEHVVLVPGSAFMAEGYCRLSYAISDKNIREGMRRIRAFVDELQPVAMEA